MPSKHSDVYKDWLQIKDADRPLNHYQLLRLKLFEDDQAKIRAHFHKMSDHVHTKYGQGETAELAHKLVTELTHAMLTLTGAATKDQYDARLGRKGAGGGAGKRRSLEDILLGRKILEPEQLTRARKFADTIGVDLRDAVIQQKLASPDAVMQAYAESLGMSYIELGDVDIDEALIAEVPAVMARQHSLMPLLVDDERVVVASPNQLDPEVEDQLRLRFNKQIRLVLCSPAAVNEMMAKHYPREAAVKEITAQSTQKKAASTSTASAGKTKDEPVLTKAERKKKKGQVALASFGFSVMVWMVIGTFTGWNLQLGTVMSMLIGVGIGAVVAGIAYFVAD